MKTLYTTFCITLLLFIINSVFFSPYTISYSSLPPNDRVNRPGGGGNCTTCHGTNPLNSGTGSLTLTIKDSLNNIVSTYAPNKTYNLTVQVSQLGVIKYGFELAATTNAGASQAGTLVSSTGTGIGTSGGISYIKHDPANSTGTWNFKWKANVTNDVTFYFVGNAANSNNNPSGDFIYANSLILPCATTAQLTTNTTATCTNTTLVLQNYVASNSDSGTWSGNFVSNNVFDATAAGVGNHTTTFTTGAGSCTNTAQLTITVSSPPNTTLQGINSVCENETQTYYTNATTGASYNWTVTGGTIISGGAITDTTITILWNNSNGTVQVTKSID